MQSRSARFAVAALLASLLSLGIVATNVEPAFAHTPHDQISGLAVSPDFATDHIVFTISDSRPLRSTDGGRHWVEMVRGLTGQNFQQFAIAPSDPQVVYLSALNTFNLGESRSGPGIFRSDDQGLTWKPTNTGRGMANVTRLAVSPTSTDVVLAAESLFGTLYRSVDGGSSWTPVPGVGSVNGITFVPKQDGRVVVVDAIGLLHVSDDDGATFRTTGRAPEGRAITSIAVGTKASGSTLFAGTAFGSVLRSDDGGYTWAVVTSRFPAQQRINSFALSDDYARDHSVWASAFHHGVYRSTDAGKTWKPVFKGLTLDSQADKLKLAQFGDLASALDASGHQRLFLVGYDGLFTSASGTRWESIQTLSEYITGLAVSPGFAKDGTIVVNTYVKGVYVSRDRGQRFVASNAGLRRTLEEGNKLLPVRRMHNVVFSPGYPTDDTIFTATWDRFISSTDGGRKWKSVIVAPSPPGTSLRQFVIALSPDLASDHTTFLGTRQGNVYRSTKGGAAGSWSDAAKLPGRVRSIVVSPAFATDRTVFAGTERGTFVSHDQGTTWTPTGPKGIALLAISPGFPNDGTVFAGTESGLAVTRDRGATWTLLTGEPLSSASKISAVALSPSYQTDRTVLVSVAGEGLFRSTDAGATFAAVGSTLLVHSLIINDFENPTSEPIQFSPAFATDHTVFAYAEQSVVRSTDGGDTWRILELPPAAEFTALNARPIPASADAGDDSDSSVAIGLGALAAVAVLGGAGFTIYRKRAS